MNIGEIESKAVPVLKKHGAKSIGVFGSYARGEAKPGSDLDLLVDFSTQHSLFEIAGIEIEVSEALGIKVDLITRGALSPYLADSIRKELVVICE